MEDSSGNAMPANFSFEPKAGVSIFSGKMVWSVAKCSTDTHIFTSMLNGTAITGNAGIGFTAGNPSVSASCPKPTMSTTTISVTKGGKGTFDCVMTFPFTIDTTASMAAGNIKRTAIPVKTTFGTTTTVKTGPAGGSLDVVSAVAYAFTPFSPCPLMTPSPATVNLGTYSTKAFDSPGYTLWQTFNVGMGSCYDLSNAQFTFTYTDPSSLKLISNTGTAQGVGVELYTVGGTETVIANNVAFTPTLSTASGNTYFPLKARMKKVQGATVLPGSVAATATFTVSYP